MTLILKLDLDIVKMYHHTKNEVSMSTGSKVIAWTEQTQTHRQTHTQTDTHTDTTKTLPPAFCVLIQRQLEESNLLQLESCVKWIFMQKPSIQRYAIWSLALFRVEDYFILHATFLPLQHYTILFINTIHHRQQSGKTNNKSCFFSRSKFLLSATWHHLSHFPTSEPFHFRISQYTLKGTVNNNLFLQYGVKLGRKSLLWRWKSTLEARSNS